MKPNCIHYQNNLDNTNDMPLCVKKEHCFRHKQVFGV